jgi:hypothetical protein
MRASRTYGSMRGAPSNGRPYRNRQIGNGFEVSSETGQAPVGRGGFIRAFASSRRRNRFAARKFDEPPLTAE